MIYWFSATGNSRYAAQAIRAATGDMCVDLLPLLREGGAARVESEKPLVFVCPTNSWGMPRIVEDWISKAKFSGNRAAYFVLTCGAQIGAAPAQIQKLCARCGLEYRGTAAVPMPDNYLMLFPSPTQEKIHESLQKAVPLLERTAAVIARGETLPEEKAGLMGRLCSGPVRSMFYSFYVKDKNFSVSSACVSCGLCARVCPLKNIVLRDGRPTWNGACTHCTACLNLCPAGAIEYGKKTVGKPRYRNNKTFPDTD